MKSITKELDKNNQVYVVTPLIDDVNELNVMDIDRAYNLFKEFFPDKNILTLHGKMSSKDKNDIMQDFNVGKGDILISTTVIEVGVNVKRATVMVICDADRFGLAALHQLRGRVGRASFQSYCILLTNDSENERLKVIEATTDGFKIAEADLKLRGPGDYLGDSQSGYFSLDYADFYNDIKIYECAKKDAKEMLPKFKKKEIESNIFNDIIKNEVINRNINN
jgi:ATP-dependent DNA helicase RecG